MAGPLACPCWGSSPSQLGQPALNLPSFPMQLSLRLKAMKRQMEEAEEEIDRLESSKKKLQRELEEQMDVNEQLQGQLNSMKKNLRWARGRGLSDGPTGNISPLTRKESSVLSEHSYSCCLKSVPYCPLLESSHPRDESGCVHFSHPMCSVGPHMCHP